MNWTNWNSLELDFSILNTSGFIIIIIIIIIIIK